MHIFHCFLSKLDTPLILECWVIATECSIIIPFFLCFLLVQFASLEKAKEVEEFFANHPMPAIARTLKQSLERVNINANWVQSAQNEKSLADAVKELAYRNY